MYEVVPILAVLQAAFTGILAWLGKIWIERLKTDENKIIEEFKSELQKGLHSKKILYEKEFNILIELTKKMHLVMESVQKVQSDSSPEAMEEFEKSIDELRQNKNMYYPFYSAKIAIELNRFIQRAHERIKEAKNGIQMDEINKIEDPKKRAEVLFKLPFLPAFDEAYEAIRERVTGTSISKEDYRKSLLN